ncbi:recombinase family protein [Spirillospora sp. NPDC046719]
MNAANATAPGTVQVGYARCSTDEQDGVVQTEQLLARGVPQDRVYIDRGFSGTTRRNRGGLDQAAAVWPGTVFTVTKFDRFARNMAEANQILTDPSDRGVLFGLGGSVYDWNDPFGRVNPGDGRRVRGRPGKPAHPRRHGAGQEEWQAQGQAAQTARAGTADFGLPTKLADQRQRGAPAQLDSTPSKIIFHSPP